MADFQKGPNYTTPFGRNEFLRSTQDIKTTSYTFSKEGIPTQTIDGHTQKVLQTGTILAKITSGAEAGKVGVYLAQATDGREVAANIVGICNTFLPWTLMERDVEVAAVYEASVVQAWCIEWRDAGVAGGGAATGVFEPFALTDATRDAMAGSNHMRFLFK